MVGLKKEIVKKKKKEFGEKSRLNCNVEKKIGDFLGGSVVKNPPCNGEHGFNPSFGTKIPPVELPKNFKNKIKLDL